MWVKIAAMVQTLPGGFGCPDGRGKMLDEELVQALAGGEDPGCGLGGVSVRLGLTRGHDSLICRTSEGHRALRTKRFKVRIF